MAGPFGTIEQVFYRIAWEFGNKAAQIEGVILLGPWLSAWMDALSGAFWDLGSAAGDANRAWDAIVGHQIFKDPVGWFRGFLMTHFPELYWFSISPRDYVWSKINEAWGDWGWFTRDPWDYIFCRIVDRFPEFYWFRVSPRDYVNSKINEVWPWWGWLTSDTAGLILTNLDWHIPFFHTLRTDPVGWLRGMFMVHFPPLYWFWIDPVSYVDLQIETRWPDWRHLRTDPGSYIYERFTKYLSDHVDALKPHLEALGDLILDRLLE